MQRCLDCGALTKRATRCRVCSRLHRLPRDRRNTAARGGSGWAWQRTRRAVLERDGHRCIACGATGVRFEVDHVLPLANGGSNELRNLRTLCLPCHRKRQA
ncbi:MAG: HNH endonuclease [Hyphomicrobiales bacterium]